MRIKPFLIAAIAVTAITGTVLSTDKTTATAFCSIAPGGASLDSLNIYKSSLKKSSFEDYIIGVVAAEMPASYNSEALKAQAVASRTYALRALENAPSLSYSSIGQAYITENEMRSRWGSEYNTYYKKIKDAVSSTKGIIAVYEGKPILAAFCASSGGKTEESQNVWGQAMPYLIGVDSHWDSKNTQTLSFTENELTSILGGIPEIQSLTQSGYVQSVFAGGRKLSGIEVRQRLGLKSANFYLSRSNGKVYVTTRGYGHGVGMSQTGANAMADEGCTFDEILSHYYPGTDLAKMQ